MSAAFLDNPLFLSVAFHPRPGKANSSSVASAKDGTIDVSGQDGIKLGYRFFPCEVGRDDPAKHPIFVHFHGNAEMCEDFDMSAPRFWKMGASLLVFANKQDIEGALTAEQIREELGLDQITTTKRHWRIEACSAFTGAGLAAGVDWLVQDISSRIFMHD